MYLAREFKFDSKRRKKAGIPAISVRFAAHLACGTLRRSLSDYAFICTTVIDTLFYCFLLADLTTQITEFWQAINYPCQIHLVDFNLIYNVHSRTCLVSLNQIFIFIYLFINSQNKLNNLTKRNIIQISRISF